MKTDADIGRENFAFKVNDELLKKKIYNIHVIGGGKKGPYTMIIEKLTKEHMLIFLKELTKEKYER